MRAPILTTLLVCAACGAPPVSQELPRGESPGPVHFARLVPGEETRGLDGLRAALQGDNPGFDVTFEPALERYTAQEVPVVVFVQAGAGRGRVGAATSELAVGDLVLLRPGETLEAEGGPAGVIFHVPSLPADPPTFVRVDFDPAITDTPGGCATDPGAYRRVALTWLPSRGPYVCHGLNAHRVRIDDSFTHYHPLDGGFDELYLVQDTQPGARLLTSHGLPAIESPEDVDRARLDTLLEEHPLAIGDLVYIPRGVAHRGLGGAVVHVIAIPGFRPGAEIGLDHVLAELNRAHGCALPLHASAAEAAVVK